MHESGSAPPHDPHQQHDSHQKIAQPSGQAATRIVGGLAVVFMLQWAQAVILPLVLAVLLSYALDPLHRRVVSLGVRRGVSAALVLLVTVAGLALAGAALRGQAVAFVDKLPAAAQEVHELAARVGKAGNAVFTMQRAAMELKRAADQSSPDRDRGITRVQIEEPVVHVSDLLWQGSLSAVALTGQAIIVLCLVYYLLAGGDRYRRKIVRVAGPSLTRRRLTLEIMNQITAQVERFLVARLLISAVVGLATGLAFWALRVPQPAIWGLGAGVLNVVPYIGPGVVAAAAAILGLVQFHTVSMALVLAGVSVLIATGEGLLVSPWLLSRVGRMNPGAVFIGLTFWGWIWGICGLLLAVPILMVIKAICDHADGGAALSELLSE